MSTRLLRKIATTNAAGQNELIFADLPSKSPGIATRDGGFEHEQIYQQRKLTSVPAPLASGD
ncbi:MAG: hypothetical protein WBN04_09160 [Paracoccaceae bacterium]